MGDLLLTARTVVGLAGLGYFSVEDIRKRELATFPILLVGLAGLVLSILGGAWDGVKVLCQFLPGLVCLALARVSRESIGYGDGLVILCLGCYLAIERLLELCMAAFTLAGLVALVWLVVLRRGRKATLPLVPFLFMGYVWILVCGGWE